MESQSQKLILLIEEIVSLLGLCDTERCLFYRNYLEKRLHLLNRPHELHKVAEDISKIYGGMGSFNDMGICKNSNLLIDDDLKFENLHNEPFLACERVIVASRQAQ